MFTAVIKVSNAGSLQQIQVGAADIVATLSAAHSAWGWIGGLTGVSSILRFCQRKADLERMDKVFRFVEPENASCWVLGQQGLVTLPFAESSQPFGDTPGSRLLGATLCAMAHIMDTKMAVKFLQKEVITRLFKSSLKEYPGSRETICTFLADNYRQIINEGTAHHLNERFDEAILALDLVRHKQASSHPVFSGSPCGVQVEARFIQGFLKWLLDGDRKSPYYTRSATVARLATCMKCVGYQITGITIWNGTGARPAFPGTITLVTAGASETDTHANSEDGNWYMHIVHHYYWQTVGVMIWSSSAQDCNESLYETLQQDFEDVHAQGYELLHGFRWAFEDVNSKDIQAFPLWKYPIPSTASRIATRLASIYFPENAERVGCLYEKIAQEKYLEAAKPHARARGRTIGPELGKSKESQRFQAMSASICISFLSRIAGDGFESMRHSTLLDFTNSYDLAQLCAQVDLILAGGCTMSKVIIAVAAIHCASDNQGKLWHADLRGALRPSTDDLESSDRETVVGWRNGRYAILPALLFALDSPLHRSMLGLQCVDVFIGNLPTKPDGSVRCPNSLPGALEFDMGIAKEAETHTADPERATSAIGCTNAIFLGPPSPKVPDKALYISLERPSDNFGEPMISLCGRIDGESVGNVSIQEVLATLALSWSDDKGQDFPFCVEGQQHKDDMRNRSDLVPAHRVYNVPASRYCRRVDVVPLDNPDSETKHNMYVQIQGSTPWALFLAGQNRMQGRVTFACPQCAVYTGSNLVTVTRMGFTTLLGYQ